MKTFHTFISEGKDEYSTLEELIPLLKGLRSGSSTCFTFDGHNDSGNIHRGSNSHLVWDNNKYDRSFPSDRHAAEWLLSNKYKYTDVDSINDEDDE